MDVQLFTYKELAEKLQIKLPSVRQMVRRKRWRTIKQNDGKEVKIEVPLDALTFPEEPEQEPEQDGGNVEALKATIAGLEKLVDAEKRAHDAQKARADAAEADRDAWRDKANRPWWRLK